MRKVKGFTLVEVVVTMVVAAILVSLAIPAFTTVIKNNRLATATNALVGAIGLARSEAIRRNARVTLCKSSDGASCTTAGNWSDGWIVFIDRNSNAAVDTGEDVLRVSEPVNTDIDAVGNSNVDDYISFVSTGQPQLTSGGFQAGTIKICDDRAGDFGRNLVLNLTGRLRLEKEVSCP